MPKKTKKSVAEPKAVPDTDLSEKPPRVSNELFWTLVIVTFAIIIFAWSFNFKKNLERLSQAPGSDFSTIKGDFDQTLKKFQDNLSNSPDLNLGNKPPLEVFKDNALAALVNQNISQPPAKPAEAAVTDWQDFKSSYGFTLQYPTDWSTEEKKVGDWFEFSLSQTGDQNYLKISNLPVDFKGKVALTDKVTIDGQSYDKFILKDDTKSAYIKIDTGKYKGYYVLYPTSNADDNQLFESILETVKFN